MSSFVLSTWPEAFDIFGGDTIWNTIHIFFRRHGTILNQLWTKIVEFLNKHNMDIHTTPGDGYCFLNSVLYCLDNDYGDKMTLDNLIRKIVRHLCTHYEQYTNFHTFDGSPLPAADTLIEDALEFFKHGNYMHDIVDLLMQITADALRLNLFIYQKSGNNIQVLNFQHPLSNRVVHVRFTHNNLHSLGNHYNSIICVRPQNCSLSETSTSGASSEAETCDEIQKSGFHGQSFEHLKNQDLSIHICPDDSPPTYSSIIKQQNGRIVDLTVDDSDSGKSDTTFSS